MNGGGPLLHRYDRQTRKRIALFSRCMLSKSGFDSLLLILAQDHGLGIGTQGAPDGICIGFGLYSR